MKIASQQRETMEEVQIKCDMECNIMIKTEPTDDDLEGSAPALCVTELRVGELVTNNEEKHSSCNVKLESLEDTNEEKWTKANKSNGKRKPRRVRRDPEKRHECKICHKHLSGISSLKAHYRTHTGEKPYQCGVCKNRFNQKAHLDMHVRTHTGGKPYECNVCETRFTQKINLQRHFRSHNGEKPYECTVCRNRFTRKSALIRHSSLHLT